MDSRSALSKEDIKAVFDMEFNQEFDAFEKNIRTVAMGNTGLANTWTDYLGLAGISASALIPNITLGILAGLKIVTFYVTVFTGAGVAVAGIAAAIIFRKARLKYKRGQYETAEEFLDDEMDAQNKEIFRETLFNHLYPALKYADKHQINDIVKVVIAAIANLILHSKIEDFSQLNSTNFREYLQESLELSGGLALDTKLIMQVINDLAPPQEEQNDEIEEIAKQLAGGSEGVLEYVPPSSSFLGVQTLFASSSKPAVGSAENSNNTEANNNNEIRKRY